MGRHSQNRWVPPAKLSTPERDAKPLTTPEGAPPAPLERRETTPPEEEASAPAPEPHPAPIPSPPPASPERSERQVRLAAARAVQPEGPHWLRVWQQGRDAAVAALEGGSSIATAYALAPPTAVGCRDCWMRGRDAALRVIQGV
jgi:hypothetical protein